MTGAMELRVRQTIDVQAGVEAEEEILRDLHTNVGAGRGVNAPTQSTLGASQFRKSGRQAGDDGDDDEEGAEEEGEESGGVGAVNVLKRKIQEHEEHYTSLSMQTRSVFPPIPLKKYPLPVAHFFIPRKAH